MSYDSNTIIEGILKEAEEKARAIKKEADAECDRILKEAKEEAEKKKSEELRQLEISLSSFALKEESAKRSAVRAREMKIMDSSYKAVMQNVESEISSLAKDGKLRDALIAWTVEAAIGLDKERALISVSDSAPLSVSDLKEAERIIKEKTGLEIALSLDERKCPEIGVVATSLDRKISYNNLLSTRLRRYSKDIRKIIQEENAR